MTSRWLAFAAVGAAGFGAQFAALWFVTGRVGVHYLSATLAARELAIVLNFFCHAWWTWSDRPANTGEGIKRFFRFHLTNGAISLIGAALLMPLLVEVWQLPYLIANLLTVGACSAANFIAADRIVFTPAFSLAFVFAIGVGGPTGVDVNAAELRADTLDAFNRYVSATEARMDREGRGSGPFLWIDRLPDGERLDALRRLKGGDIVVTRAASRDATGHIDVPHGLIHHWIGTVFVPGATVDRAVSLMQDYGRYQEIYSPNVRRSRMISRDGDRFKVYLQLFMSKVISVVLNTEYDVRYTQLSPTRVIVRSYSTRIAEVHDPGTAREREAAPGEDSGFLWRFYAYWSFEERAEGTYIQCESVSLSRAIPVGLGWIVGPFVTSIPRESLSFTLERIRMNLSSTALPGVSSLRSDRGRR